jgi:2-polyprenyl-3-methyl-5-hydroxy-6-metoxy-1,4-benzoquinol methylase
MRDKSLHSGERQVGRSLDGVEAWHKWRYEEARLYIYNQTVLDVGCGTGYGSFIMSRVARQVIGIDDSEEAIQVGRNHYSHHNIIHVCGDFLEFKPAGRIDAVVSFENIEHVEDTDAYFAKLKAIDPQTIILSCPHLTTPIGGNKFHFRHYGMDELVERFRAIGYRVKRAELLWFGNGLCNFIVVNK